MSTEAQILHHQREDEPQLLDVRLVAQAIGPQEAQALYELYGTNMVKVRVKTSPLIPGISYIEGFWT